MSDYLNEFNIRQYLQQQSPQGLYLSEDNSWVSEKMVRTIFRATTERLEIWNVSHINWGSLAQVEAPALRQLQCYGARTVGLDTFLVAHPNIKRFGCDVDEILKYPWRTHKLGVENLLLQGGLEELSNDNICSKLLLDEVEPFQHSLRYLYCSDVSVAFTDEFQFRNIHTLKLKCCRIPISLLDLLVSDVAQSVRHISFKGVLCEKGLFFNRSACRFSRSMKVECVESTQTSENIWKFIGAHCGFKSERHDTRCFSAADLRIRSCVASGRLARLSAPARIYSKHENSDHINV